MPDFVDCEVSVEQCTWSRLKAGVARRRLNDGTNLLRIRAVSVAGGRGPETYVEIRYGR